MEKQYTKCDFCPKSLPNGTCLLLAKWDGKSSFDEYLIKKQCEQAIDRLAEVIKEGKKRR